MAHHIQPPRGGLTHAILDMDGNPLSWHRSAGAAEGEIAREGRAFRRRYPGSRGHLPRSVVAVPAEGRYVARMGAYSTSWH